MVAAVPAQISKLPLRVPAAALRRPLTHHSLPTTPLCDLCACLRRQVPHSVSSVLRFSPISGKPANSRVCIGLPPLCTLSCPRFLCFQQLAASFPKTPGVGVPRYDSWTLSRSRRGLPVKEMHRPRSFRVGEGAAKAPHSGMSTGFSLGSASSVALPRCK